MSARGQAQGPAGDPAAGTRMVRRWWVAGRKAPIGREETAVTTQETGHVTGTKDKDYNLIWYVEACLDNALRLETYIEDAQREGDNELADLFRKAQADSRKGADMGKQLLRSRLAA
jgi:hypothetical protein